MGWSGRSLRLLAALLPGALLPGPALAAPIVLELFTSQSCSSCPPADALLGELAGRPDVLALDLHVDYWNGIGWHDPFSLAALTRRQQRYATLLGQESVYTPELVVAGHYNVVGSDRAAVMAALAAARDDAARATPIEISVRRLGGVLIGDVGAGRGGGTVWLVGYDPSARTRIGGGENGGRTLDEVNIVRSIAAVGTWSGPALHLEVSLPAGARAALLVQADDGRIIGAARPPI